MASLSTDPNGNRTVKVRVEALNALAVARLPMDADTAAWVAGVGDELAGKLAAVGLIPQRKSERLGGFLEAYLARRSTDAKGATVTAYRTTVNDLIGFFGAGCPLRDIGEQAADDFKLSLQARELAPATVARRLRAANQFFRYAVRVKAIPANPFVHVTATSVVPEEKKFYLPASDAERLLAVCDPRWRIMVALSRFAGLRCPSEVLSLKWADVNFESGRMTVPSPKTEHHAGGAYRVIPIFPGLRPYLDDAFELAESGAEYVVPGDYRQKANKPGGWQNASLATRLKKLIRRAGLTPWPRPFHNMRASFETDLMRNHPIHVVCKWLGNTPAVAMRHYLQVTETDFSAALSGGAKSGAVAVHSAVQSGAVGNRQEGTKNPEPIEGVRVSSPESAGVVSCPAAQVGATGLEPVTPTMSMWYSSQLS
jgi:integrase